MAILIKPPVQTIRPEPGRYEDVTTHRLIAKLCVEMAEEVYEEIASRSNAFYKVNCDRADFVRQIAPKLKTEARQILTDMLTRDDVSEAQKREIHEALVMDRGLPEHGTSFVKKGTWN